jgi:hypothetical protein
LHEATGAVISLPDRKRSEAAHPTYVGAVRLVLSDFGIADEVEFASQLQKAS